MSFEYPPSKSERFNKLTITDETPTVLLPACVTMLASLLELAMTAVHRVHFETIP